jgi:putative transcriptional regulator
MQKRKRNIGQEILDGIREIKAGGGKRYYVYGPKDIKRVRLNMKLSQADFASVLHVSPRTLQAWEQGQRHPSSAVISLLAIAAARPEVIKQVSRP